ncbi:CUZD1 isoform 5 [Pan troglodytes]|uniref:CUB and zona pellucida like domains 1 n=2 Tax=Homininae TaxID=207598 RepID=A0A0A0MRL2_HUMAN|nr:CUB and zona pellucida like domains 1 [Homo sapiens]PNI81464.1 CUZD1 isoform 2 [Pan troglodytes]KAI2557545.1 CUB and zona pellucida like domains 1 [Homo sapiens]KAI4077735.1 CUB and zona pellucida like domains 1 [Homo sapiens]KAI4077736.1 CUB and zona pellucida like domains 1 [Homo sapiens]
MELVRRLMPLTLLILSCLAELTMAEAEGLIQMEAVKVKTLKSLTEPPAMGLC